MKLTLRDFVATILVAAIAVPYVGYLMNGEMPFIKDPRGMSAVGLILGVAAFLVLRGSNARDRTGTFETGLAVVGLVLGIVALAFAEAASAEVLLAVFMGAIFVIWAVEMADHAGWMPGHRAPAAHI